MPLARPPGERVLYIEFSPMGGGVGEGCGCGFGVVGWWVVVLWGVGGGVGCPTLLRNSHSNSYFSCFGGIQLVLFLIHLIPFQVFHLDFLDLCGKGRRALPILHSKFNYASPQPFVSMRPLFTRFKVEHFPLFPG